MGNLSYFLFQPFVEVECNNRTVYKSRVTVPVLRPDDYLYGVAYGKQGLLWQSCFYTKYAGMLIVHNRLSLACHKNVVLLFVSSPEHVIMVSY